MRPGTWLTSCPEALRIWEFEKKKTVSWDLKSERVSWDSSLEESSRFLVSPRRDHLGSTKCAARLLKKLCVCVCLSLSLSLSLSLLMSKNLKLKKVVKSFVPEPISCFSFSYTRMNILWTLWTFSVSVWTYIYFTSSYLGRRFLYCVILYLPFSRDTVSVF